MIEGNCGALGRIQHNFGAFFMKKKTIMEAIAENFVRRMLELEVILMVFRELGNYSKMS